MLKKNSMEAARAIGGSLDNVHMASTKVMFYFSAFCLTPCLCTSEFGSACLRLPPADSKSSKLRADIDRCLVCIPRALMANGEGTKKRDEEGERAEKFPSLAPLRRLQNAPPPSQPPPAPRTALNLSTTATGGLALGWRRGAVRWRGGKGGKRVAFQNSFRVRQRLESSVAGGWQ